MPRNMSFALTTEQFKHRTKTVTRRLGWEFLKPGDHIMGCKKCMGFKPGERIERLGLIQIKDVRREPLDRLHCFPEYGRQEMIMEGFPGMDVWDFIELFKKQGVKSAGREITRIEFAYL